MNKRDKLLDEDESIDGNDPLVYDKWDVLSEDASTGRSNKM